MRRRALSQIFDEIERVFDQDRAEQQSPMAQVNLLAPEGKKFGWGMMRQAESIGVECAISKVKGVEGPPSFFPRFVIYLESEHIHGAVRHQLEAWLGELLAHRVNMEVRKVTEKIRRDLADVMRIRLSIRVKDHAKA